MTIIDMLAEMCENYLIQTLDKDDDNNEPSSDETGTESISE